MNVCPACEQSIAYTNSRCPCCGMRTPRGLLHLQTLYRLEESFTVLKVSHALLCCGIAMLVLVEACLPQGIILLWNFWYFVASLGMIGKRRCFPAAKVTGTVVWVEAALLTDLCTLLLVWPGMIGMALYMQSSLIPAGTLPDRMLVGLFMVLLVTGPLLGHFFIMVFLLKLVRQIQMRDLTEELRQQVIFNGSMILSVTIGMIFFPVSDKEILSVCARYVLLPMCLLCATLSYLFPVTNVELAVSRLRNQMLSDVRNAAGESGGPSE